MKTIQEEIQEHVVEFKNEITRVVIKRFNEDKEITPIVFALILEDKKPKIGILAGLERFFSDPDSKNIAAQLIKESSNVIKPIAIAFICEGWGASYHKDEDISKIIDQNGNYIDESVTPKNNPNRKEILFMSFETYDQKAAVMMEIVRDGEEVSLKEMSNNDWEPKKEEKYKGKFADLLKENYSAMAEELKESLSKSQN